MKLHKQERVSDMFTSNFITNISAFAYTITAQFGQLNNHVKSVSHRTLNLKSQPMTNTAAICTLLTAIDIHCIVFLLQNLILVLTFRDSFLLQYDTCI